MQSYSRNEKRKREKETHFFISRQTYHYIFFHSSRKHVFLLYARYWHYENEALFRVFQMQRNPWKVCLCIYSRISLMVGGILR